MAGNLTEGRVLSLHTKRKQKLVSYQKMFTTYGTLISTGQVSPFMTRENTSQQKWLLLLLLFASLGMIMLYCFLPISPASTSSGSLFLSVSTPLEFAPLLRTETEKIGTASYVYLIRHAEKVSDRQFGLSVQGSLHAACYASFFSKIPTGAPTMIMSAFSGSRRAILTAIPIAATLNVSIYTRRELTASLVEPFIKAGLNLLLVLEHKAIPLLATALACPVCRSWAVDPTAQKDQSDYYAGIWRLKYQAGRLVSFASLQYPVSGLSCPVTNYNTTLHWQSSQYSA